MDINDDLTFDQWFDIFQDEVRSKGYSGPLDKYSFESDYEETKTPEAAASEFIEDISL